jgi:RNA polymerase sigma-70 factor (ECF subfamily)
MEIKTKEREFTRLITENKGIVYKVANSYCADKNDVDDLAQEIVYNLWKSFDSFDTRLKFSTWMYRVALNVAISSYRQEKKLGIRHQISEGLIVLETGSGEEMEENLSLLQDFISELKEVDKAIILLYLDDKSQREMAEITGFSASNIGTRINRIKEKLRTKFTNK